MKILIACETSGTVREAFRKRGHDAWSLDVLPAADGSPFHIMWDALDYLSTQAHQFDLLIGHPPCTYLTCSAEWAYKDPDFNRYPGVGYHQKLKPGTLFGAERRQARKEAVQFFLAMWNCGIPKVCLENPIGHMAQHLEAEKQLIQPYQFGHDASKSTALWLKNLPPLTIKPELYVQPRMVNGKPRWSNQTDGGQNKLSPSDDRWSVRSKTYQGIADSMAATWG